mgnify:CR=1 FL=1|tara:strand:+ start:2011 stop:3024 length:1014 start_codon:yes stop_codon:yes gene_type:complete
MKKQMNAYEITCDGGIETLRSNQREIPSLTPNSVLVKIRANSINYRDLMTIKDPVSRAITFPRIPNSDGSGEVIAVGENVSEFKTGDRVVGAFFESWESGNITQGAMTSARGGAAEGLLCEYAVSPECGLVLVPDHLSFMEASTLPCAGVTAWHALVEKGCVKAGDTVLIIGTGGVSLFALQFAILHGAKVILVSSSDEKIRSAKKLGAWEGINYSQTKDWHNAVCELTAGGVDHVVETGGPGTLPQSIEATRLGGHIWLIGVLTQGQMDPINIMRKSIHVQGIYVGHRSMFKSMNSAIAANKLHPVIFESFGYAMAKQAYLLMESATHFGKIVIDM